MKPVLTALLAASAAALRLPRHTAPLRPSMKATATDELPSERLAKAVAARRQTAPPLGPAACKQAAKFLNELLPELLLGWVMRETEIGATARSKNMWSNGAYKPLAARCTSLDESEMKLEVDIQERGKPELTVVQTKLALPCNIRRDLEACEIPTSVDDLRAALLRLAAAGDAPPASGSILLRLPGASDEWSLPDDLWLNTTPYRRSVRQMFYGDVTAALRSAVADKEHPRRMKVWVTPPEINMEMDSYRVGTLLELVREIAISFGEVGMRCRVCVQGPMGEGALAGVPRVLSGVNKVMRMMDWEAGKGEAYEGMLGNVQETLKDDEEVVEGLVRFGAVKSGEVKPDDEVIIVIAPQSMVGASIYEPLRDMVEEAEAQGAAVVLLNPLLQDRPSSGGVMGVRGRGERMGFADSFKEVYHFRLLYSGTTFMYPILGAIRMSHASQPADEPALYVLFQRREDSSTGDGGRERYDPVGAFLDVDPPPEEITKLVPKAVEPLN